MIEKWSDKLRKNEKNSPIYKDKMKKNYHYKRHSIQFKTKQANYSLHTYKKWQNNHKDIILNIILHLKTWTFSQRLKNNNDKKRTLKKNT